MGEFQIGNVKYNTSEIKGGLKKADLDENNKEQIALFDKIAGEDGELSDAEANDFFEKLLAKDDGDKILSESEMKKYLDEQDLKDKPASIVSTLIDKMKQAYDAKVAAAAKPEETAPAEENEELTDEQVAALCKEQWQKQGSITCRDTSGHTNPIAGTLEILDKDFEDSPKEIVITSSTSGNKFKYEMFTKEVEGKHQVFYKCVSMNDRACISENEYELSLTDDGNFELVQMEGQNNWGTGLKFASEATPPAQKQEETPKTEEIKHDDTPKEEVKKTEKKEPTPLTEEVKEDAINDGKSAAKLLIGITFNESDQIAVDNIVDKVTDDNVLKFIKGYEDNREWFETTPGKVASWVLSPLATPLGIIGRGVMALTGADKGDHFFTQLQSEWDDDHNAINIKKVGRKLINFLEARNNETLADQVKLILANENISSDDAKKLDEIVKAAMLQYDV